MASFGIPIQVLVPRSRFSSLYLSSSNKKSSATLPNSVVIKNRSLVSRISPLAFSPLPENRIYSGVVTDFSVKNSRFFDSNSLLRRNRSSEFPVVSAAADADDHEIEISDDRNSTPSKSFSEKYPAP